MDSTITSMPTALPINRLRAKASEATRFRCADANCCYRPKSDTDDAAMDAEISEVQADDLDSDFFGLAAPQEEEDIGDDPADDAAMAAMDSVIGKAVSRSIRDVFPFAHSCVTV